MDKIEKFFEGDNRAFSVMEVSTKWILDFIFNPPIPKTSQSLFMMVNKINTIKNAIYDLRESENVYAMSILLRSLIEHFLRLNYLMMRALETRDDSIGEKFIDTLYIKEVHDLAKAYKKMSETSGNVAKQTATWEAVNEIIENSKSTTKKEVEEDVKEFQYGEIIKYIDQRINKTKTTASNLLINMFPHYSELSSFVHGGRLSDMVMMGIAKNNKINERIDEITETAYCTFVTSLFWMFFVFSQYDKKFGVPYLKIEEIIKETFNTPPKTNP